MTENIKQSDLYYRGLAPRSHNPNLIGYTIPKSKTKQKIKPKQSHMYIDWQNQ